MSFKSVFSDVVGVAHGLVGVVKPVVVFIGLAVTSSVAFEGFDEAVLSTLGILAFILRETDRPFTVVHSFSLGVLGMSSSSSCGRIAGERAAIPNPAVLAPSEVGLASSSISNKRSFVETLG